MSVELKDIENVAAEIKGQFDEFKAKNDKRLEAIDAEKGKLAGTVETLNEKLTELDRYKSALEDELKSLKRPGVTGGKEVEEHKTAFGNFLRKGRDEGLRELEKKALNVSTDEDGGYAVPEELDRTLVELMRNDSPMRQVCNVISIGTSDYKRLVNLGGAGSGWVGEEAARPATDSPTLAQIAATMGEIYANPQATQTSLDDIFFNAEAWITAEIAREFAEKEAEAFLTGNGTNKPKGILASTMAATADASRAFGTLQTVKSGAAGAFGGDALLKLIYTLKKGYRQNAQFMMAGTTLFTARTLKDNEGNYLWAPGLQAGQPSSLIGYGIAENDDMPVVAADANAMMFGDFKRGYTIVDRMGTRMLRDPFTNKPYIGFYTTKRVGGMLVDSNAIKVMPLSA